MLKKNFILTNLGYKNNLYLLNIIASYTARKKTYASNFFKE